MISTSAIQEMVNAIELVVTAAVDSPVTTYLRAGLQAASTLIVIMKNTLILFRCLDIVWGGVYVMVLLLGN